MVVDVSSNTVYMCVCLCAGFCLKDQFSCGWGEKDCFTVSEKCNNNWDCRENGGDERGCGKCVHCPVLNTPLVSGKPPFICVFIQGCYINIHIFYTFSH